MRAQNRSQVQEAKPSPAPRPYPVSIRAYKKKDYEYISTFSRTVQAGLRATGSDEELLQWRSDCESDYSLKRSSTEYVSSTSFAGSTSSAGGYGKDAMALMEDLENHHYLLSAEMSSDSAQTTEDGRVSHVEVKEEKLDNIADLPSSAEETSAQVKAPLRSQVPQARARPRRVDTQQQQPAVLPKFGAWDTRNPSSGEAYTAIFRRLRDEKKSGGLPACASSPTHSKPQGKLESSSTESIAKESHHVKSQVRKSSSRSIAKDASQHEGTNYRKYPLKWSFCCKASVLDD